MYPRVVSGGCISGLYERVVSVGCARELHLRLASGEERDQLSSFRTHDNSLKFENKNTKSN